MAKKTVVLQLSEIKKNILLAIIKRRDSPQHLVRRAKAILLANEGQNNKNIARQVALGRKTVGTWRIRWSKQQEKIDAIEADGNEKALREFITEVVLADDPYNGKRGTYTPEQVTQLYKIACEHPQESGRPISHWSCRELAEEMVKRGIVEHIPISTVWAFLKSGRLEAAQGGRMDESQTRRSGRIRPTK